MTITVTSTLFAEGETIPTSAAYGGAGGDNISPDLSWTGIPDGTASIAITCWDPDAPTTVGFTHWVLFNLDPSVTSLAAGAGAAGQQPEGSTLGITDWGDNEWGGMYPPPGDPAHHYIFTVWALDEKLGLDEKTPYAKLRFMMGGHVLDQGALTGRWALPA
jgi:hypothetical protein